MVPEVSRCDRLREAHRCDGAPCPLCNSVDLFDFAAPIRSVRYFGAAGRDAKIKRSRKRRSFLVTDGRWSKFAFSIPAVGLFAGAARCENFPRINPLPSSDRTEDTHRARL
jgi:hypothetical protein